MPSRPPALPRCTLALAVAVALGCAQAPAPAPASAGEPAAGRPAWALAIHGGAGVIPKTIADGERAAYERSLAAALAVGRDLLAGGADALDAVEAVVRTLEEDPLFNAGKGAVFTHDGGHELDAAIMDGRTLAAGAVAGLTTVRSPIGLARRVMERSPHVFLAGPGAELFAGEQGVERVDPAWFDTDRRRRQLEEALEKEEDAGKTGTVGAVALDRQGHLAAATSTGGMTNKRWGRIGDVPVLGAGTYADDRTAAVSCTGFGEQFIRHTVARSVTARMEFGGQSLEAAAAAVLQGLDPGDGGLIAVDRHGHLVLAFNSPGMFRGAADASGRFEVAIWE